MDQLKILEHIIEERLYESGLEDETPMEFIEEVCLRFFSELPKGTDIQHTDVEDLAWVQLRNKIDADYDLNLFRLKFVPLYYKQIKDL